MTILLLDAFWIACLSGLVLAAGLLGVAVRLSYRENARADAKAGALLRSWLTPDDARRWGQQREIEVIGCDTGTRYRIRRTAAMNIDELDSEGSVVNQWCFAPKGVLALDDVILGQKVALETIEHHALALANKKPVSSDENVHSVSA